MPNLRTVNNRRRVKAFHKFERYEIVFRYKANGGWAIYPRYKDKSEWYVPNPYKARKNTQKDDLNYVHEYVDRVLTEQFGPDHQEILSRGQIISEFRW